MKTNLRKLNAAVSVIGVASLNAESYGMTKTQAALEETRAELRQVVAELESVYKPSLSSEQMIAAVNRDPASSTWLRNQIANLMNRDVLDAARDAETLAAIFRKRADEALDG